MPASTIGWRSCERSFKPAGPKADYGNVAEEIYRLREQKQNANREELRKRMADMRAFLREQPTQWNSNLG